MAVVRRIYPFVGMELTGEVEAAMEARVAARPEYSHGAHSYSASAYGISEGEIREQFADYMDRFDLWPRGSGTGAS